MDEERLEKAIAFMRDKAKEYADAKANRVYLQEFRKSKKAILMAHAEQMGAETVAQQERDAYRNDEYIQLLQGIRAAVAIEERLRYQLKAAELTIEIWRTKEASRRAERKAYRA